MHGQEEWFKVKAYDGEDLERALHQMSERMGMYVGILTSFMLLQLSPDITL